MGEISLSFGRETMRRDDLEDLGIGGRIIEMDSKEKVGHIGTGFNWYRIGALLKKGMA
jgi:hypothetical protein